MAIDKGTYVIVEKGDTLSQIAQDYAGGASKYKMLATINNIENPNLIYVNQKIYLSYDTADPKPVTTSNIVKIHHFGLHAAKAVENELIVTWVWDRYYSQTEGYTVWWEYTTSLGIWLTGSEEDTKYKYSTYKIPAEAKQVRVRVKPVPTKKTVNGKDTPAFTADWTAKDGYVHNAVHKPTFSGVPTVTISEDLLLTASLENVDETISIVEFEVVQDDATVFKTDKVAVSMGSVSYACTVPAGSTYKVRCRGYTSDIASDWANYSSKETTRPANPSKPTKCEAKSETSIYLEWEKVNGATKYVIEYTTDQSNFDMNDKPISIPDITNPYREVTDLKSGLTYYFRIKAVDNKNKESKWSEVVSGTIGTGPIAPTTWSSSTTAITAAEETVSLYWVHNTEDNSSQTYAEVELIIDGTLKKDFDPESIVVEIGSLTKTDYDSDTKTITYTISNESVPEKDKDKTHSIMLLGSNYVDGAIIKWRVRTAGATQAKGDWSTTRTIYMYSQPSMKLMILETQSSTETLRILKTFPFYISTLLDSVNVDLHHPVGYYVAITAGTSYPTVDSMGNSTTVNAGQIIYSKHFNAGEIYTVPLIIPITPGDLSLENGIEYTVTCVGSLSSGLTATATAKFTVSWDQVILQPSADITIDTDTYTALIRPYCSSHSSTYYKVLQYSGFYVTSADTLDASKTSGDIMIGKDKKNILTTTGEHVYQGFTGDDGEDVYYTIKETVEYSSDVLFDVYRREFDGSFTAIETKLDSALNPSITDPHPALDYARYRVVATDKATGAVNYYDIPNFPVGGKAVIIQWDEKWSTFEAYETTDTLSNPPWTGSLLVLSYNIDVADASDPDVSLIKYIGRKRPVSYYGTQLGEASSWNMVIPKSDKETLYGLRRLAAWSGNVYVREPSGSGYWANIKVSFAQKHLDPTIPITLDITRVEGGA